MQNSDSKSRALFRFITAVPTRWGDADALGHVNNVLYVRYLETGRLDYLHRILKLNFEHPIEQTILIADMQLSYLKQIAHPTNLEVTSRISRLGNTSFDVEANIYIEGDEKPVVTSKAVAVWFNLAENRKEIIPQSIRELVSNYEVVKPC